MASDQAILRHHREQRDRVNEPRPVSHHFEFASMAAAQRFGTAARAAGFPMGESRSSDSVVFVSVDRLHPLVGPDDELHEDFSIINELAAAHNGTRLDWSAPMMRYRPGDSILSLIRRALSRRRLKQI